MGRQSQNAEGCEFVCVCVCVCVCVLMCVRACCEYLYMYPSAFGPTHWPQRISFVSCHSFFRCPIASINWHEIPLASYWHELQLWSHSPMEPEMRWPTPSKAACNVLGADAGSWQIDEQCSSCSRINKELQFLNGQQCFPPRWSKLQQQQHNSTSSNVFANSSNVLSTGKHFVVLLAVMA